MRLILRTLNEGVGLYLLGLIFLVGAALLFRVGAKLFSLHSALVSQEILWAMSENEPRTSDVHLGVTATILGPINGKNCRQDWTLESLASRDRARWEAPQRQIRGLQHAFSALVDVAYAVRDKGDREEVAQLVQQKTIEVIESLRQFGLLRPPEPSGEIESWKRNVENYLVDFWKREPTHAGVDPGPERGTLSESFGSMRIVRFTTIPFGPMAPMLVPSLVDLALERGKDSLRISSLLPLALSLFNPGNDPTRPFVQAYFISPHSHLALWPAAAALPPTKLWASTRYFEVYFGQSKSKPPEDKPTAAYVDYGGNGIVITEPKAVTVRKSGKEEYELVGVLYADYRIPEDEYLKKLAETTQLFEIEVLTFDRREKPFESLSAVRFPRLRTVTAGEKLERKFDAWAFRDAQHVNAIREALASEATFPATGLKSAEIFRRVTPVRLNGKQSFLIPLGKTELMGFSALMVTPKAPTILGEADVPIILAALAFGLAAGTIGLGGILASKASRLETKVAYLRSLPVGLVIVGYDPDRREEVIEEANDRAEQILETKLPKIGLGPLWKKRLHETVHSLIDPYVIEVREDGQPSNVAKLYADTVLKERQTGLSSRYYAKIKRAGKWVYVCGTPMLDSWKQRGTLRSFGIFDYVAPSVVSRLERALKVARGQEDGA
jgi:hypothetical protein